MTQLQDVSDPDLWRALDRLGVLSQMPPESRASLMAAGHVLALESGEHVQRQGEPSRGVCCILRGQVRFSSVDENGSEFIFHIGYAGAWFGHAVFDGLPVLVSATAMVPSQVFVVPANHIRSLVAGDPEVALFVIRSLTRIGRSAIRRLKEQLTLPSEAVVASLLLQQLSEAGSGVDTLRLSHSDVARMCGLSLKTVGRVLQGLKRKKIVGVAYSSLAILDCAALARAASVSADEDMLLI